MSWQARTVSFVLVVPSIAFDNAGQIFQVSTGSFPQMVQQLAPVGTIAGGPFGGGWANLQVMPGRLQIDIVPTPGFTGGIPTISDISGALTLGQSFASKLAAGRVVTRIGCVIDALREMASYEEARADVLRQLPFLDVPEQANEIVFQLNCPTTLAALDGVQINRLCRWSSIISQMVQFDVQGGAPSGFAHESHASSLFVDVNTDARWSAPFAENFVTTVCRELAATALATLTRGYDALR